jgi:hypothetical protein
MDQPEFASLLDIAQAQAEINARLKAGNAFGEIAERVSAEITGSVRIRGTGRDLKAAVPGWTRPADPIGLAAPGPVRTPYAAVVGGWHPRDQRRYRDWLSEPTQIGEVKSRQVDRNLPPLDQFVDTRGGGPHTPFFPLVDFYLVIMFDLDGDILMARRLELAEIVDYVASDVGRGGKWNYKVSISSFMTAGTDLTRSARSAIRRLPAPRE